MSENKRFPQSWENATHEATLRITHDDTLGVWDEAAKIMAESYEAEIYEKDKKIEELQKELAHLNNHIDRTLMVIIHNYEQDINVLHGRLRKIEQLNERD